MPNHFTLTFFFAAKGVMYHVAIATMIFSHVKICFCAKAHLVFHWYLYNKNNYSLKTQAVIYHVCVVFVSNVSFQSNSGTLERSSDGDQSTMLAWKEGTCHNAVLFSVSYSNCSF